MKKVIQFFRNLFKNSLFLKILSVLIAIGVWLYIINIADPRTETKYEDIPISFVYEGTVPYNNSLMPLVTSRNFFVDIVVSGPRTSLFNLSKDKITASLNFNSVAAEGTYDVPISIGLGDDKLTYEIVGDDFVTLEFAKKSSTTLDVSFQKIGSWKTGYSVVEQTVSPDKITVEGPKNIIDTISSAEVRVDVSDYSSNVIEIADIVLMTADRGYVDRTYLTLSDAQVTVSVALQYKKSVKVTVSLLNPYGGDESGYATVSYSPSPYLQLQGDEDTLSLIDNYNIGSIDLTEIAGKSKVFEFNVSSQNGISVVSENKTIAVTVDISGTSTRNYTLTSTNLGNCVFLNTPEGMNPRITNIAKTVTVRAQDYTLGELNSDALTLTVDLSATPNENGEYPLIIGLPSGVSGCFMNKYYVSVDLGIS